MPPNKLTDKQKRFIDEYLQFGVLYAAKEAEYKFTETMPKCEFYVYGLVDESADEIFYIGKGKGKRLFSHVRDFNNSSIRNARKHEKINEIYCNHGKVKYLILHETNNEESAYITESVIIRAIGKDNLTNIVLGSAQTEKQKAAIWAIDKLRRLKHIIFTRCYKTKDEHYYYDVVDHLIYMAEISGEYKIDNSNYPPKILKLCG